MQEKSFGQVFSEGRDRTAGEIAAREQNAAKDESAFEDRSILKIGCGEKARIIRLKSMPVFLRDHLRDGIERACLIARSAKGHGFLRCAGSHERPAIADSRGKKFVPRGNLRRFQIADGVPAGRCYRVHDRSAFRSSCGSISRSASAFSNSSLSGTSSFLTAYWLSQ
jgi:hypothetical protein